MLDLLQAQMNATIHLRLQIVEIGEMDARQFRDDYEGSLENALNDDWSPNPLPERYREALLRQLCSRFYSLAYTTLGSVAPARRSRMGAGARAGPG